MKLLLIITSGLLSGCAVTHNGTSPELHGIPDLPAFESLIEASKPTTLHELLSL